MLSRHENNGFKIDRDAVREAAIAHAEDLFIDAWGEPSSKGPNGAWRWGDSGGRVGNVSGPKAGTWHDFRSDLGGDILEFWAIEALGYATAATISAKSCAPSPLAWVSRAN